MLKFRQKNSYYSTHRNDNTGKTNSKPIRLPQRNNVDNRKKNKLGMRVYLRFNRGYNLNQNAATAQQTLSERDKLNLLRQRRRRIIKSLRTIFIIFLVLVIFLRFFIHDIKINLKNESTSQPNLIVYSEAIDDYLNTHPLERLSFNLNQEALEQELVAKYPEIQQSRLMDTGFLRPSRFEVTLRTPVAVMTLNQQRFYVDANGISFLNNYFEEPKINIQDQSGLKLDDNSRVISGRLLSFIGRVIAMLSERGYQTSEVIMPAGTVHRFDIRIDGFNLYAKMTIDNDPAEQVENLVNSLEYVKRVNLMVEYLDVRVKQKAFYK